MRRPSLRSARPLAVLALLALPAAAQTPAPVHDGVDVVRLATVAPGTVRLARDLATGDLYTLTISGDLHRFAAPYAEGTLVATAADHGLAENVLGLALDAAGTVYLTGNDLDGPMETSYVRRGVAGDGGGRTWSTVAQTAPFVRSATPFDHHLNGIVVSPDGAWLFVNHGSRTEHGEVQSNDGTAPGLREVPLTSLILRLPASATDLLLPNDEAALRAGGYLYADGVRNSFDLAFDGDGHLYATENSGDRDDADELNWIREGHHYGFPWRMGRHDTPQRFPGYDPDADPLLNPAATGYQIGAFHDDPSYPPPPAGVTFTDPVENVGPDADHYRDPVTGALVDGSDGHAPATTFTPHRSPLGLTFDVGGGLPFPFTGAGFVLSWTDGDPASPGASPLLVPLNDPGQDLLVLGFFGPETVQAVRLVRGFSSPMDAVLAGEAWAMYVVELGGTQGLWRIDFSPTDATEPGPEGAAALRVSPNPFRTAARVAVEVGRAAAYRVEVTDVLGRRVALLHDGPLGAGAHAFALDGGGLPAGLYRVGVAGPDGAASRSVVRVR
jgi:hypothetical protein